jgi:hypothetical protein
MVNDVQIKTDSGYITGRKILPAHATLWWRWVLNIPKTENPLRGGYIGKRQHLPFLCLACTGGPGCTGGGEDHARFLNIDRRSERKRILIPIFATEYSTAELGQDTTDDELMKQVRTDIDNSQLQLIIDGYPIENLNQYYVESGPFQIFLPKDHLLEGGILPGYYRALCGGWWIMLDAMPRGQHTIKFGGTAPMGFHTSVSYKISYPKI